jgi:hypothetical protein
MFHTPEQNSRHSVNSMHVNCEEQWVRVFDRQSEDCDSKGITPQSGHSVQCINIIKHIEHFCNEKFWN